MKRALLSTLSILLVFSAVLALAQKQTPTSPPVSYKKQIAPLFAANCNACHSAKTPQSGLATAAHALLLKGGRRGNTIVPGKPDQSLLLQYIDGRKQPRMPIGGALKPQEIALIKQWIAEGAKSDGEAAAATDAPTVNVRAGILPQAASLAWAKDGKLLAVGTYREVKLFNAETGKLEKTFSGHADVVRGLVFSPDGATLAAAGGVPGQGGEIKLWNVASGVATKSLEGHADCIYGLAWRPDSAQIATTSYDKTIKLWDVAAGKSIADLKDHADAVYAAGYSANGKYLATASADRSIRVWDAAAGKRLYTLAGHTEMVTSLSFHPTADQVVTAGADKAMRLWNLRADAGDVARTFNAVPDVITDARFSPDGKLIATASNDGSVRIWEPSRSDSIRTIPASTDAVLTVAFSPNSQTLAVGGYDGSVKLFKVADGSLAATLIAAPTRTAGK